MIRQDMIFSGRVQGVGFRATAREMARDLELTGWVKNLPDGRVHVVAEGREIPVLDLAERLEKVFEVQALHAVRVPATGEFVDFVIKY